MLFGMWSVSLPAIGVSVPIQHTPGASLCLVVGSALPHVPHSLSTGSPPSLQMEAELCTLKDFREMSHIPVLTSYIWKEELATRLERAAFPTRPDNVGCDKEIGTV